MKMYRVNLAYHLDKVYTAHSFYPDPSLALQVVSKKMKDPRLCAVSIYDCIKKTRVLVWVR